MSNEDKLKKFRQQIDESKRELLRLEGEEKGLLDTLKKEYNISSLKEAEKRLEQYKKEIDQMTTSFNSLVEELEKQYVIE